MFFKNINKAPVDPIFGLKAQFLQDKRKNKTFLSIGVFQDLEKKTPLMNCIKEAEKILIKENLPAEYLPIEGNKNFIFLVSTLVFGSVFCDKNKKIIAGVQTVGGTSALRLSAEFCKKFIGKKIYLPNPTWLNHKNIFHSSGIETSFYSYYKKNTNALQFEKMMEDLSCLPKRSIILFHAVCHNPTGADPSLEEWNQISKLCKEKEFFPVFDFAYQGFGDGIEEDARAIRLFAKEGHEMLVAFSGSKNFGLYRQRVGALLLIGKNNKEIENAIGHIKCFVRGSYSNPPGHGAALIEKILSVTFLKEQWLEELNCMRNRITGIRKDFVNLLSSFVPDFDFSYIEGQRGLFCLLNLSEEQINDLIYQYGIYLPINGRINMAGLNNQNIEYIAKSIKKVLIK